jgi:Chalcone isomerase-like
MQIQYDLNTSPSGEIMRSIHTAFSASLVSAALVTASLITLPLQAAAQTAQASAKNPATASINNATGTTAGKFPETAGPLTLNGWGTRKRLGFEVYHVGLYTQTKSVNGADHLTLAKPVRLTIRFARELENEQFTRILLAAMRERVNMSETPTMIDSMLKFSEVFSSIPVFKLNDEVTLSLFPGGRMEFAINGDNKNFKPITEAPLARGLLSIYVGANPVDAELKGNLLEGGPKAPEGKAKMAGGPRR